MTRLRVLILGMIAAGFTSMLAASATATTIIPVSDEDLTANAQAIVEGRCVQLETAFDQTRGAVFTFVTFEVTAVHKGNLSPGTIVLKQMGGSTPEGTTIIWGAPYWAPNWRMLLFLNPDSDGALRVAHWSLGYFRILGRPGTDAFDVVRPEAGVHLLPGSARGTFTDRDDHVAFVERVRSTLVTAPARPAAEFHPIPKDYDTAVKFQVPSSNFTFQRPGFRWFEPDSGAKVRFTLNPTAGATPSSGRDEAAAAAVAWSTAPGSSLRVEISRETSLCGVQTDGANTISFGDCRDAIDDPVNCGGVVAIGGITQATPSETKTIGGQVFNRILEADISFNNGFDCLLSDPSFTAEVMTHEMGHTLGLGHSSGTSGERDPLLADAIMFFTAHNDGRGARLGEDDWEAVRFLHRSNVTSTDLAILTGATPDIQIGVPYSFTLKAAGTGPFVWTVDAGQLPSGITLSPAGVLTGTCPAAELETVTVSVRDGGNFVQTRALTLRSTGEPAPFIESASFKASGKLTVKGIYLAPEVEVTVNEVLVTPPRTPKFKATKGSLVVKGKAADLNVRTGTTNRVVVTLGGRPSNAFSF